MMDKPVFQARNPLKDRFAVSFKGDRRMKKILIFLLGVCMLMGVCSCSEQQKPKRELSRPSVFADESLPGKHRTVWDCVYFGSYPTAEVTDGEFTAVDEAVIKDGDVIRDRELYRRLSGAEWTDDETVVDGVKYRRLKGDKEKNRAMHYQWNGEYHYFKYEPVKWRVMEIKDGIITLMADKQMDCEVYNVKAEDVYWENCTLRSFLNGYGAESNLSGVDFSGKKQNSFYNTAFSDSEKESIVQGTVKNPNNYYFGTPCGNDTKDMVFIFDEEEIFDAGKSAVCSGFASSDGTDDAARRFKPTMYAMAKGAWYSLADGNEGNGFWLLRTSGYTPSNVNYICDFGAVYNRGTYVTVSDAGILPVIRVYQDKAVLEYAGTVSSDEIFKVTEKTDKDKIDQISDNIRTYEKDGVVLSEPVVVKDQFYSSGYMATWDSIYFGSYPSAEITGHEFSAVDDYAVDEGDIIIDVELYERLVNAEWQDDETVLDGEKYRRLKEDNKKSSPQHYQWDNEYHYFRYEPIKWRIAEINGSEAMLICDREMDCEAYNTSSRDVMWENCTLRSFLNGYGADSNIEKTDFSQNVKDSFFNTAFSEEEKNCIIDSEVENPDNSYYGTDCGNTVKDKVFILSSAEVFSTPAAARHGFYAGSGVDDSAKRFRPTMYAKARGTWYSPVENYKGNGFWYMRTNGYSLSNATYICDFGYIYNRGTDVICNDSGILPAMNIDLSKAKFIYAEKVSSQQ